MTKEELDKKMDAKWTRLIRKNIPYGVQYLIEMHKLLDWYEKKLSALTNEV